MHELSLAMNMVEQLQGVMRREKAQKLHSVIVEIGALSGVEKEPMMFCFPLATRGTELDGAELIIEEVPLQVRCRNCSGISNPEFPGVYCVDCGDNAVDIIAGRDFKIRSIEVE